jgi:hypothetical protein
LREVPLAMGIAVLFNAIVLGRSMIGRTNIPENLMMQTLSSPPNIEGDGSEPDAWTYDNWARLPDDSQGCEGRVMASDLYNMTLAVF